MLNIYNDYNDPDQTYDENVETIWISPCCGFEVENTETVCPNCDHTIVPLASWLWIFSRLDLP